MKNKTDNDTTARIFHSQSIVIFDFENSKKITKIDRAWTEAILSRTPIKIQTISETFFLIFVQNSKYRIICASAHQPEHLYKVFQKSSGFCWPSKHVGWPKKAWKKGQCLDRCFELKRVWQLMSTFLLIVCSYYLI